MTWLVVVIASGVCGAAVWEVLRQAFERHLDRTYPDDELASYRLFYPDEDSE